MHPYYKHTNTFHFEHDICWVTGMKDIYHAGIIDKAHIVDKQLAGEAQYDQHNQIKLNSILHKLFDKRLIWFVGGTLHTVLTPAEQKEVGIQPGAKLVDECLPDRTKYFEQRLNDANEYHMATNHKASIRKTFQELALKQGWV